MKICVCCSLTFTNEVNEVAKMLQELGHEVLLPNGVINRAAERPGFNPVQAKIESDAIRRHFDKIREADAVLVCNFLKNCTPGYIGANTFAELAAAYYFNKPIFALFPLPDTPYIQDELNSFGIQVLDYDLARLAGDYRPLRAYVPASQPAQPVAAPEKPLAPNPALAAAPAEQEIAAPEAAPDVPAPSALPPLPPADFSAPILPPVTPDFAPAAEQPTPAPKPFLSQLRDAWTAFWHRPENEGPAA